MDIRTRIKTSRHGLTHQCGVQSAIINSTKDLYLFVDFRLKVSLTTALSVTTIDRAPTTCSRFFSGLSFSICEAIKISCKQILARFTNVQQDFKISICLITTIPLVIPHFSRRTLSFCSASRRLPLRRLL